MIKKNKKHVPFEIFPWNANFETGIEIIDQQHAKLVEIINRLAQQYIQGLNEQELTVILSELAEYAHYHFESEESIWQENLMGLDRFDTHIESHQKFFEHIKTLQNSTAPFYEVLEDIFSYLTRWLAFHILESDKRMAKTVLAIRDGLDLTLASERADQEMSGAYETLMHSVLTMYDRLSMQALDLMHEKRARERAEEALKLSEERLQFLLASSGEDLWEWSNDQSKHLLNDLPRLMQLSLDEENSWTVYPGDLERIQVIFSSRWSNKDTEVSCKYRLISKQGNVRWMRLQGKILSWDSEGLPTQMIGASQDISERELALQLMKNGHETLIITDAQYRIQVVNDRYLELCGYALEDLVGRTIFDQFSKNNSPERIAQIKSIIEENGLWRGDVWHYRADGADFILDLFLCQNTSSDLTSGETPDQLILIGYDVTASRQTEQDLRTFKTISDQAIHGNAITDLEGNIVYINDYLAQTLGYTPQEVFGKPLFIFYNYEQQEELKPTLEMLLADGFIPATEFWPIDQAGQEFPMLVSATLIRDAADNPQWIAVTAVDITELKQLEQVRSQAEEAKQANTAKSIFLSNMSHEIRTPMNAILGFSQLLSEQIVDPLWLRYLEAINTSGQSLLRIINDILDLSKIEAGKIELQLQAVNLNDLIQELKTLMSLSFEQKEIHFEVFASENCSEWFELDSLRLRQVLLNLLGNALKFTEKGKVVLNIQCHPKSDDFFELSLSVTDTGIGITPERQAHIFKAFEQDTLSNVDKVGTGLGLTISRSLVELMGGALKLESTVNQGSTFTVILPCVQKSSAPDLSNDEVEEVSFNFTSATILIADDVSTNLFLLEEMLKPFPFAIYQASNGEQAYEMAKEYQPDLILMDIKMPIMAGPEALNLLRKDVVTQHIPVVALTAFSLNSEREQLLQQGFHAYLRKPVQFLGLYKILSQFLHSTPKQTALNLQTAHSQANPKNRSVPVDTQSMQQELKTVWIPRCLELQNSFITSELEQFGNDLLIFAQNTISHDLRAQAEGLLQLTFRFDLDKASDMMVGILLTLKQMTES